MGKIINLLCRHTECAVTGKWRQLKDTQLSEAQKRSLHSGCVAGGEGHGCDPQGEGKYSEKKRESREATLENTNIRVQIRETPAMEAEKKQGKEVWGLEGEMDFKEAENNSVGVQQRSSNVILPTTSFNLLRF